MFVVMTKTLFAPEHKAAIVGMSDMAVRIASRQPGFKGIRVHLAHDDSHTMTYWRWESEQAHLDCMSSPDWEDWNPRWAALLAEGVEFELDTYEVLAEVADS